MENIANTTKIKTIEINILLNSTLLMWYEENNTDIIVPNIAVREFVIRSIMALLIKIIKIRLFSDLDFALLETRKTKRIIVDIEIRRPT